MEWKLFRCAVIVSVLGLLLEYASQHELRDFLVNGKSFTELLKEYLAKTT